MADLTIYLGSKNYSTWSVRAWLALKRCGGVAFDEQVFDLTRDGVRDEVGKHSPSRLVPALRHGERLIWDSLAICEYLAETFPEAALWPSDAALRAVARAVSAEMHSGFVELRRSMPMNVRRRSPGKGRTEGALRDIDRIRAIWSDCRERFGAGGEYLFGDWTIADCMYAPVVSRLVTYDVRLEGVAGEYAEAVWADPLVAEWRAAAEQDPSVNPAYDL